METVNSLDELRGPFLEVTSNLDAKINNHQGRCWINCTMHRDIWIRKLRYHKIVADELKDKLKNLNLFNDRSTRKKRSVFSFLFTYAQPILNLLKGIADLAKFAFHNEQIKSVRNSASRALIRADRNR